MISSKSLSSSSITTVSFLGFFSFLAGRVLLDVDALAGAGVVDAVVDAFSGAGVVDAVVDGGEIGGEATAGAEAGEDSAAVALLGLDAAPPCIRVSDVW